jgi:adenine nucleotide transporter 17
MRQIFQKDGIAGLWSGAAPSAVLATNPAVQFMVYEALKRRFQSVFQQKVTYSVLLLLL